MSSKAEGINNPLIKFVWKKDKPINNSIPIINRDKYITLSQFAIPILTRTNSKNSIGNNLATAENLNNIPTRYLKIFAVSNFKIVPASFN